jgi:hypothetical protein
VVSMASLVLLAWAKVHRKVSACSTCSLRKSAKFLTTQRAGF